MTIESTVSALTTATTNLLSAVGAQQTSIDTATSSFNTLTNRVFIGLNRVDNTSDLDKPISSATKSVTDAKQNTLVSGINISTVNGVSLLSGVPLVIARSATSLNKVAYEDRATLRGSVSQVDDSTVVDGLGLFMWVDTTSEPDDDETCFTAATGQWLLKAPSWELIDAWNIHEKSVIDDWMEDEPLRYAAYKLNK